MLALSDELTAQLKANAVEQQKLIQSLKSAPSKQEMDRLVRKFLISTALIIKTLVITVPPSSLNSASLHLP